MGTNKYIGRKNICGFDMSSCTITCNRSNNPLGGVKEEPHPGSESSSLPHVHKAAWHAIEHTPHLRTVLSAGHHRRKPPQPDEAPITSNVSLHLLTPLIHIIKQSHPTVRTIRIHPFHPYSKSQMNSVDITPLSIRGCPNYTETHLTPLPSSSSNGGAEGLNGEILPL